jgi:hypothetical protein
MHTRHIATHRRQSRQPLIAHRADAYERPAGGSVLPEQFFDSRIKLAVVCAERALMYAVLEDAFLCFYKRFEADQRYTQSAREVKDWFLAMTLAGSFRLCLSAMRSG